MDDTKYILYNRLEDILCFVGTNARLKINLNLYKNNIRTNEREYYLKEIRYIGRNNIVSKKIIRTMSDGYLSLENLNQKEDRIYIVMTGKDLEYIRIFLLPKLEFLIQNYNQIFELREDKRIYINENYSNPIQIQLPTSQCILWFKPGIYVKMHTEESIPCIEMYMNSQYIMSSISFPNLYEFIYILRTLQIQTYLSSMLSYLDKPSTEELEQENAIFYYTNLSQQNYIDNTKGFFAKQLQERKNK